MAKVTIDITFDFRTDATSSDPDATSPTLMQYHHRLWSKQLPSGERFDLRPKAAKPYALVHSSGLGEFFLTSDSVLQTFTRRAVMQPILGQLPPADIVALNTIIYTIGGMILWPGKEIGGKTINQLRGLTHSIADRFDLTSECVRRHYEHDRGRIRSPAYSAATRTSSTSSERSPGTSISGVSKTSWMSTAG